MPTDRIRWSLAVLLVPGWPIVAGAAHAQPAMPALVDPAATAETRALFLNLRRLAPDHVLFGHQDDLAYGVEWFAQPGRSDVKEVAGSYPAVYGWDIGDLEQHAAFNLDSVAFDRMRDWIVEAYERGGVSTISWHLDNPVSGGNAWDTTPAVATLLPGGSLHDAYRDRLDVVAAFLLDLRGAGGEPVPVIFRPFHEMSGHWFWWGDRHTTPADFRALWRFTVEYLRDERNVHNLLWAYSTNALADFPRERYWRWYPGDEYVDILGFDDYYTLQRGDAGTASLSGDLRWLVEQAEARDKLAALTETGAETIPDPVWWTRTLLAALERDPVGRRIAWVLVWRNANRTLDRADHYYAPYAGHSSAADFIAFRRDPLILFEEDLPDLYRLPPGAAAPGTGR